MMIKSLLQLFQQKANNGRISEIIHLTSDFYGCETRNLSVEQKLNGLCAASLVEVSDIDLIISQHSEVERTVKGHAFESVFDAMMKKNGIDCQEVGGDSDVDRQINGFSLQLKTPFENGCKPGFVSYKTHKTHGAKSEKESMGYYHRFSDFADFLIGLVSYKPFSVLIIKKNELPCVEKDANYIKSPAMFSINNTNQLNNFSRLNIKGTLVFPESVIEPSLDEKLPKTSKKLKVRTEYILNAIFDVANFRIWDMNMRGFIREFVLTREMRKRNVQLFPVSALRDSRADKVDVLLKDKVTGKFARFQVKGLTWGVKKTLDKIDCETQLSRGRINDDPTQSRLYHENDFDYLIIMIDPVYENTLSIHNFSIGNYDWGIYCIPVKELCRHATFTHRIKPHQYIAFKELQKYKVLPSWYERWFSNRE